MTRDRASMTHCFIERQQHIYVVPTSRKFVDHRLLEAPLQLKFIGFLSPSAAQQPAWRPHSGLQRQTKHHIACTYYRLRLRLTVSAPRAIRHHAPILGPGSGRIKSVKRLLVKFEGQQFARIEAE